MNGVMIVRVWGCGRWYLEFGEPLDGLEGPQDPQHSERLDGLDVASFVVPAGRRPRTTVHN